MQKVKLLQPWLGADSNAVGDVIEVSDEVAADILVRGKRGPIAEKVKKDAELAEKPVAKMNRAELDAKAAELEVDISGAKNNRVRAKLIQEKERLLAAAGE